MAKNDKLSKMLGKNVPEEEKKEPKKVDEPVEEAKPESEAEYPWVKVMFKSTGTEVEMHRWPEINARMQEKAFREIIKKRGQLKSKHIKETRSNG